MKIIIFFTLAFVSLPAAVAMPLGQNDYLLVRNEPTNSAKNSAPKTKSTQAKTTQAKIKPVKVKKISSTTVTFGNSFDGAFSRSNNNFNPFPINTPVNNFNPTPR